MIQYEHPSPREGDEDRYAEHAPRALCEACEVRPGSVSEDGAWLCTICSAALELYTTSEWLRLSGRQT